MQFAVKTIAYCLVSVTNNISTSTPVIDTQSQDIPQTLTPVESRSEVQKLNNLFFGVPKSKRGALPKRGDCASSVAATTENIAAIRLRANLSLVGKAVSVANGELIKNRLGTSKLLYFQCISGKQIVPYVV